MTHPIKSRRGVYYDLEKSPYQFQSRYGDIFKFSSEKKLEIYTRDIKKEVDRFNKIVDRFRLDQTIDTVIIDEIRRAIYQAFYSFVER